MNPKKMALLLAQAVKDGFDYDPGDSDLDDEQPIYVNMTLGDYRRAVGLFHDLKLFHELKDMEGK
jgi:hypothetical protein